MTNEPSPRPWRVSESASGTMSCIRAANGEHIASCFGMPNEADAALIVDAVNGLRSEDAPAGFDPYCARHGCPNCRIYARLQEAKKKKESK